MTGLMDKILVGAQWTFLWRCVGGVLTLGLGAVIARVTDQPTMAAYFVLATGCAFLAMIGRLGMRLTVMRYGSEGPAESRRDAATSTALRGSTIVVAATLIVLAPFASSIGDSLASQLGIREWDRYGIWPYVWVLALALQPVLASALRALRRPGLASALDGPATALALFLSVVAVAVFTAPIGIEQLCAIAAVTMLAGTLLAAVVLAGTPSDVPSSTRANRVPFSKLLASGIPNAATTAMLFFISNASIWIAARSLEPTSAATYIAAFKLITILALPLTVINMALAPYVPELGKSGRASDLESTVRVTAGVAGMPALLLLVPFLVAPSFCMALVYGEEYASGGTALAVMAVGQMVNVFTGSCGIILLQTGRERLMMKATTCVGVLSISLTAYLAASHGLIGLAVGVATGMVVQNAVFWYLVYRTHGVMAHASFDPSSYGPVVLQALGVMRKKLSIR